MTVLYSPVIKVVPELSKKGQKRKKQRFLFSSRVETDIYQGVIFHIVLQEHHLFFDLQIELDSFRLGWQRKKSVILADMSPAPLETGSKASSRVHKVV